MAITYAKNHKTVSAGFRVLISAIVGLAAAGVVGALAGWRVAPLVGWEVAATIYLAWSWLTIIGLDDKLTPDFARREDPSRAVSDIALIAASLMSLVSLGLVLTGGQGQGGAQVSQMALGVLSVLLSWFVIHTVYMLRYAELYYQQPEGGVNFEGTKQPTYADFAYLAFTLGMTFQVSDTDLKSTQYRTTALKHALLSYLFGTIIVATTINLVAGLISG